MTATKQHTPLDFSRLQYCRFHQCGASNKSLSTHELREFNTKTGELLARAENSGCESCYVEVARWSQDRSRWEWFCFEKMMDVCFMDDQGECIDISDWDKAVAIADYINNGHEDSKFIPNLPKWEG